MSAKTNLTTPPAPPAGPTRSKTPLIVGGAVLLVAILALVAVLVSKTDSSSDTEVDDSKSEYGTVTVTGTALPVLDNPASDPAVGSQSPVLSGTDFNAKTVEAGAPGKPTLLLFVAHWCPHCQREVPVFTKWVKDRGGLGDVNVVVVVTSTNPSLPNYPPSRWLANSGIQASFIRDDITGTASNQFGLPGFPYFVALNAGGKVVERQSGELSVEQLESILAKATKAG